MSSRSREFKSRQLEMRGAKSSRKNHEELNVMHSDDTLDLIFDADNIDPYLKEIVIETAGGKLLGNKNWEADGLKYWNDVVRPNIIRLLNEQDDEQIKTGSMKPHTTDKGGIYLLNFVKTAIGRTSARDFNRFARESFDSLYKESNYSQDEIKKKSIVDRELEGFEDEVKDEFGSESGSFDSFNFQYDDGKAHEESDDELNQAMDDLYKTPEELEDEQDDDFDLEEDDLDLSDEELEALSLQISSRKPLNRPASVSHLPSEEEDDLEFDEPDLDSLKSPKPFKESQH